MTIFFILVFMHIFFVTETGKDIFGSLIATFLTWTIFFFNPISLILFGGIGLIFLGSSL